MVLFCSVDSLFIADPIVCGTFVVGPCFVKRSLCPYKCTIILFCNSLVPIGLLGFYVWSLFCYELGCVISRFVESLSLLYLLFISCFICSRR